MRWLYWKPNEHLTLSRRHSCMCLSGRSAYLIFSFWTPQLLQLQQQPEQKWQYQQSQLLSNLKEKTRDFDHRHFHNTFLFINEVKVNLLTQFFGYYKFKVSSSIPVLFSWQTVLLLGVQTSLTPVDSHLKESGRQSGLLPAPLCKFKDK